MPLSDREYSNRIKKGRIYSTIEGPKTISEIMEKTGMCRSAVTKYIWELCESGMVSVVRRQPCVFERIK